eukprot:355240-Chlamydomonas_euryale.AAC.2
MDTVEALSSGSESERDQVSVDLVWGRYGAAVAACHVEQPERVWVGLNPTVLVSEHIWVGLNESVIG